MLLRHRLRSPRQLVIFALLAEMISAKEGFSGSYRKPTGRKERKKEGRSTCDVIWPRPPMLFPLSISRGIRMHHCRCLQEIPEGEVRAETQAGACYKRVGLDKSSGSARPGSRLRCTTGKYQAKRLNLAARSRTLKRHQAAAWAVEETQPTLRKSEAAGASSCKGE